MVLLFLILLGGLAYGPVLRVPFMWDDPQMILANPHITAWTWDNLKHTFTHDVFNQGIPYYRPLQTLLNMVDFSLYGYWPMGYHLTNLLIHILNVLVLFLVLGELRFTRTASFWVAGAFAVHPIIVQELMVVAGRAELLSSFFVLLGVWGWCTGKRWGWALSILCLPVAILAKESGVVLPFLIALVLLTKSNEKNRWKELIPHTLILGVYLYMRHRFLGEVAPAAGVRDGLQFVLFQAPKILFVYIRLLFVPWHLHSHRYQPLPGWSSIVLWGVLAGGAAWGLASPERRRSTLFWGGWFFAFFLPKIPLLATNSMMLEHWAYGAGVGVYGPFMIWLSKRRFLWMAALPLVFWMGITQFNIHIRGNDALNFAHSARFSSSPWLRHNWGRDLLLRGQPAEAAILFNEVVKRHPEDLHAWNGLAMAYLALGQSEKAILAAEEASRYSPADATAWINLSTVYLRTGDSLKALECSEKAVEINPQSGEARMAQAESLRFLGRWPEAVRAYREVVRLDPTQCDARNNLAGVLVQSGDLEGAQNELERIIQINPLYAGLKENLDRLEKLRQKTVFPSETKR